MGNSRSFAYRAQVIKISLAPSPFPISSSLRTTMLSAKSRTVLVSVLVSQSRCDKSPQTRWLETAAVGFLTVPEARGSTSRCGRGRALRVAVKGARPPFPVGACRPWCAWLAAAPLPSLLWSSHGRFPGCLGPRSPSEGTSRWTGVHLNPVGPLLITNQRHLQRPSSQMRLHSEVPGGPEFGGRRTTLHPSTGTYSSGAKEVVL